MRGSLRRMAIAPLVLLAVGLSGCTDIEDMMSRVPALNFMRQSPSFDPYEAPIAPPENSVPVESPGEKWEPAVERTEAGLTAWGDTMTNPLPMTDPVLHRGAEVYTIYCSVCHGVSGQGDGPVVGQGKFPLATNLTLPTTVNRSDGYIYAVVRVGRGLMPSYRRIPPQDRWAVVNYVRHLQTGEPIPVDVPGLVQPGRELSAGDGDGAAETADGGQE